MSGHISKKTPMLIIIRKENSRGNHLQGKNLGAVWERAACGIYRKCGCYSFHPDDICCGFPTLLFRHFSCIRKACPCHKYAEWIYHFPSEIDFRNENFELVLKNSSLARPESTVLKLSSDLTDNLPEFNSTEKSKSIFSFSISSGFQYQAATFSSLC